MRIYTIEMMEENDQWVHDWVFGKMVSKASKESKRKPKLVREILDATASNTKHLNLSGFHKHIHGKIDVDKYSVYEKDILDPINDGGFSNFKKGILEWIERSRLPYDKAIVLTDQELSERVFFAEELENASAFLSDESYKTKFIETMLPKFGQRISNNKLIEEKMIEMRQGSETKVRASDPFDILYLLLLPYIDLLICDKNTHNEINQIIRDYNLVINTKLQKNEEFYQSIMG